MILSVYVFSLPRNAKMRSVDGIEIVKELISYASHLNVNQSVHLNW